MPSQTFATNVPSLNVGGRVLTDLSNLIVLVAGIGGAANGNASARRVGASTGYTPTSGKTFVVSAVKVNFNAAGSVYLGYSNNDVGVNGATAYTTLVYMGGDISCGIMLSSGTTESAPNFVLPNGKYLAVTSAGGAANGSILIYGYEV